MESIDMEFNQMIMQEIGLEIDNGHNIVDQDTGNAVSFAGMNVVEPGYYSGRNSIEFDPYNNKKMMNCLFGYFLDKYSDECDNDVLAYYNIDNGDKGHIQCKMSDNSNITSKDYSRESIKYADIMLQLNGEESPDLVKYDIVKKETIKKKRSNRNASNKSNSKTAKNSK